MIDWGVFLVPAAVLLLIPLAIIPGYRRATGSIMVSGALATIAFAAFWLAFGGLSGFGGNSAFGGIAPLIVLYCGILLTLTAWALTINAAAQARRWVWVALLVVAGEGAAAAIYASFSLQTCFGPEFACPPADPVKQALAFAGYLACPVAALVYGAFPDAFPSLRRTRKPPDGLTVSSLRLAATADDDATSEA